MTDILLHLSSGQGPRECEWVVEQLVRVWAHEAQAAGLSCTPVEPVTGPAASVLLRVSGDGARAFADARMGTIRWIGASPFRPLHRRRSRASPPGHPCKHRPRLHRRSSVRSRRKRPRCF